MKIEKWLIYAWVTTLLWGVWGAFSEMPTKAGFPATLGYIVWAISMVPCAIVALWRIKWKLDVSGKAIFYGMMVGLLGAVGQLLLFQALRMGPAYIIFPFVSMSPVVTIALSLWLLKERPTKRQRWGIVIALLAIFFLSVQQGEGDVEGGMWLVLATSVFVMWGVQAYFMKLGNKVAKAESIFVYMAISGVLLIPVAYLMTDFSLPINTDPSLISSAFVIQLLNAVGLCLSLWQSSHCLAFDRVGTLDNRGTVVNYLCGIPRYYIIDRPRIGDYRYGRSRGVTKTGYGAEQDCTL